MSLKEQLVAKRREFEGAAPPEAVTVMHRATEDLRRSGIMNDILKVGDRAPDFELNDAEGKPVRLQERIAAGPMVIGFYRGRW
jgi:hypothetical protein